MFKDEDREAIQGVSARRPPLKTAFGGTNHHHGPREPSLRSLRTGLRRGGAKIPEIRKHPPETGPQNRPENRVNTPPEGSRDSFRQRKPLTLRRFHKNRRKSSIALLRRASIYPSDARAR